MKRLLVGLLLFFAPSCAALSLTPANPFDTVRALTNAEGNIMCSAVVIAPDRALTAAHCLEPIMSVDGVKVERTAIFNGTDSALLDAPGLQCPCAEIGTPKVGDKAVAIGFPAGGPKRVTAEVEIKFIGILKDFAPWILSEHREFPMIGIHDFVLIPGDSGGGLFVGDKLVGTNSAMIMMPPYGLPFGNVFSPIPDALLH